MARLYNLARMTVTAGGTGVITLGVPVTGYLSFQDAGVTNGLTISYAINDPTGGGSEVGTAVYTAIGTTLARTVTTSTNANNPINVSLGAQVAIAPAAAELNLLYGFPTVTTDNAISRYNGTAGGTQNSGVIIDDSNNVSGILSLTVTSTDAGAGNGPTLDLFRDSASPAVNDVIGTVDLNGRDSAGNKQPYGRITAQITDPTSTTEDGNLFFQSIVAGVLTTVLQSSGANILIPGSATVTDTITGKSATPTVQRFTSVTSGTYTPTSGTVRVRVTMCGGGGGGGAQVTNNGANGTASIFGTWTANPGVAGLNSAASTTGGAGGAGGSDGSGVLIDRIIGGDGNAGQDSTVTVPGGAGGQNPRGGAGAGSRNAAGGAAKANTGAGGAGGGMNNGKSGNGGGAGEWVTFWMTAAQAAGAAWAVGGGGAGGAAGTNAGGPGGSGIIIVEEFYI